MKIIHLSYPHEMKAKDHGPLSMAIGFFDGVHKGHQQVIGTAIEKAREKNMKSAVMTFDPHPSLVLGGRKEEVFYITPLNQKMEILQDMGVDICYIVRFTSEFAKLSPKQFVENFVEGLGVKQVVAGFDFSFGYKGGGDLVLMDSISGGKFEVTTVGKMEQENEKISSTRIRYLLKDGLVEPVLHLLGRPYRITGTVVNGDKRGRTIGFPTANVEPELGTFVPKRGVYAVRIEVQGAYFNGVCNVGYKPTFHNPDIKNLVIEVHILEFDKSIYGEKVTVEWHKRIRDEQKFSGIEELKQQIGRDKETAKQYFQA